MLLSRQPNLIDARARFVGVMLALSIALLRQAHEGHERPGRMAMAINAERAARRRPIGRRVCVLTNPIDGSREL